ncbi:hypothetical protein AYI68_g3080 [Smittium mucronatum]|uniref:Uncharacterized protein n=1 Tax=Smittium mucronatum TaxID=133383 RepID=A0A1R0H0Y4_9FUNG|nr:hypothetical protein AYI68_g3080 [Smittium mucronatum]
MFGKKSYSAVPDETKNIITSDKMISHISKGEESNDLGINLVFYNLFADSLTQITKAFNNLSSKIKRTKFWFRAS